MRGPHERNNSIDADTHLIYIIAHSCSLTHDGRTSPLTCPWLWLAGSPLPSEDHPPTTEGINITVQHQTCHTSGEDSFKLMMYK